MQDRPDAKALLEGVARFLERDLDGAVADRALSFRLKVAAHLVATVARELALDPAQESSERERLRVLLGSAETDVAALERELAFRIRAGEVPGGDERALRRALLVTLRDRLAVVQPRFDTRLDVESEAGG